MLDVLSAVLAMATVIAVAVGLRSPFRSRVLAWFSAPAAAGLLTIALLGLDGPVLVLALGVTCLMLGIVIGTARAQHRHAGDGDLQSHLARCRRREEHASVLVVAMSGPVRKDVTEALRITDSAVVRRVGRRWELDAILDPADAARHIVEQRLASALAASSPVFGWATFPEDGFTLEVLLAHARAQTAPADPANVPG